ncbi:MAG TPA: AmmeMemoRadiSam system protein A [Acidimicrobiales bacterium]|nr:AmmeMemoRadiSam system protein A [Acidimicrobiales bacterium]
MTRAPDLGLRPVEADLLFDLAAGAILAGVAGAETPQIDLAAMGPALLERRGVFVTIEVAGSLSGCIGTVEPVEPVAVAVPRLAREAAFNDPRFPPVTSDDWPDLAIKISLLDPLVPVPAADEADLVSRIRIGVDGLVLATGGHRATFLPSMWQRLAEPRRFVRHLQQKAGVPPGSWPAGTRAWTYTALELSRPASAAIDRRAASSVTTSSDGVSRRS